MLSPGQLLKLAEEQVASQVAGAPRQVVLRRAVSTAYYAVFHALCGKAAETFVPAAIPNSRSLFYRAIDHGKSKERCTRLGQNPLRPKERTFFGINSFGAELRSFANAFVALQEDRHRCDYDPNHKTNKALAKQNIDDARQAIADLDAADGVELSQFLAYVLFDLRQY